MSTRAPTVALAALIALGGGVRAQAPRYEAASIKPTDGSSPIPDMGLIEHQPGGRLRATNTSVRDLVRRAYNVQDFQIVGDAPAWTREIRFDIVATAAPGFTGGIPESRIMLRTLLEERFRVRARTETRDGTIYALVLARGDRRLGPRLLPTPARCVEVVERRRAGQRPTPEELRDCTGANMSTAGGMGGAGESMADIARRITPMVDRLVVDRTGLTGLYNWSAEFDPEVIGIMNRNMGLGTTFSPRPGAVSDRPPFMSALTEQLGLKLESQRGPVDVVVFDGAELPTPD